MSSESQECTLCGVDKLMDEYYTVDGDRYFKKCKECVRVAANGKYTKKVKGFDALPEDKQIGIRLALQDRRLKIKDVADEWGLNYPTLCYWIRRGGVVA